MADIRPVATIEPGHGVVILCCSDYEDKSALQLDYAAF